MSFGPVIIKKKCKCGIEFKTDIADLSPRREKCGLCQLIQWLETREDIASITHYLIHKHLNSPDLTVEDIAGIVDSVTAKLLLDELTDEEIIKGTSKENLEQVYSVLNSDSFMLQEIREDINSCIKAPREIERFIGRMIKEYRPKDDPLKNPQAMADKMFEKLKQDGGI